MYERLYRYVLEVAKHGSITAAANELYVTPSTLSKAIQKLEDDLGVLLFDRVGKTFLPTYAGSQYILRAKEIIDLEEQLKDEMRDIVSLRAGRIRIGLQMNTATRTVQAVEKFHAQYPEVEVHIVEDTSAHLAKMLSNGEVDLTIANADPDIQKDFNLSVLNNSELVLVVPRNHQLVKQAIWTEKRKYPIISLNSCAGEHFVLPPVTQRMGAFLEGVLSSHGISVDVPIRATSIGTILRLVSSGTGITITYDSTAEPYENSLNFTFLSFDHSPNRSLVVSTCPHRYLSEAAQKFIIICMKIFQD